MTGELASSATLALSFLAPWAGLIAGLLGLGVLAVLYALRLRRKSLRVGSTMLWAMTAQDLEVNVPWKRPRASWLLLLQLLALLAIAGAIARPVLSSGGQAATRTLILIDASASMSATDGLSAAGAPTGQATRLDEARARAKELVRAARATPGAQLMVASFAGRAEVRTGWTRDRAALDAAIDAVAPTDQPADLAGAIDLVASLIAQGGALGAGDEPSVSAAPVAQLGAGPAVTTVMLLSDGGLAPVADRGVPPGADLRLLRVGPAPRAAGATSAPTRSDNVGIVAASARRDLDDPATLRVVARLASNQAGPARVTLRVELRDEPVGATSVELPPAREGAPGEATASFDITDRSGGVLALRLMNPDALASDNRVWIKLDEPGRPRIVLVGPTEPTTGQPPAPGQQPAPDAPFDADAFLRAFQEAAGAPPHEVIGPAELARRLASPAGLEGVELLILDRVTPQRLPRIPTISVGAGLPSAGVVRTGDASPGAAPDFSRQWRAVRWDRAHPVMRDVDLAPVEFFGTPQSAGVLQLSPLASTLATGPQGPIVAALGDRALRRLFIAPRLVASTWGADVSLAVMLGNAIDWLTLRGQAGAARWVTTARPISVIALPQASLVTSTDPLGQVVRVPVPAAQSPATQPGIQAPGLAQPQTPAQATARAPARAQALAPLPREVSLGLPARVGLYTLAGVQPWQSPLAVNLLDDQETLALTSNTITLGLSPAPITAGESGPARREVWPWLVVAAIALLGVESVLFALRQRA